MLDAKALVQADSHCGATTCDGRSGGLNPKAFKFSARLQLSPTAVVPQSGPGSSNLH